ncbi:MAG: FAD:protein FMN transferase [Bacteroidia bacterium]|nr:FAD:protein FMN transferase [Bacteroidia bacterium]
MRLIIIGVTLLCLSCGQPEHSYIKIAGPTMGTAYNISYFDSKGVNYKSQIDSFLIEINNSLSTYIETSTISRVNQADSICQVDEMFIEVFNEAKEIQVKSNGAFEPTIMPLVNAWGFGYKDKLTMDSTIVDSILSLVNFDNVDLIESKVVKKHKNISIDFSAIAKGYGVDLVAKFMEIKGVINYMVEIGGEVRCNGLNSKAKIWKLGIDEPVFEAEFRRNINATLELDNESMATSGNYRNYYEKDGKKYVHTINPKTGYPEQNDLLSATIISDDCMTADAYATACMVLGFSKAKKLIETEHSLEAYFIFFDENNEMKNYWTKGLTGKIDLVE